MPRPRAPRERVGSGDETSLLRALYFSSVESVSEGLLPECSIGVKEARSEDDSSRSTHGNLCMVYCKLFISLAGQTLATDHYDDNSRATTHRRYARWLKSLQARAMHKLHSRFSS